MCMHVTPIFFFNDTATTEIYTLSLHDALPISREARRLRGARGGVALAGRHLADPPLHCLRRKAFLRRLLQARQRRQGEHVRSEEHTSELQSRQYLVCRLLLEKKKSLLRTRQYW